MKNRTLTDKVGHVVEIVDTVDRHLPIVDSLIVTVLMTLNDKAVTSKERPVANSISIAVVGGKIAKTKAPRNKKLKRGQMVIDHVTKL